MTKIYLLTKDKKIKIAFSKAFEGALYSLDILSEGTYINLIKKMLKGSLVYIDIQEYDEEELQSLLQYLPRLDQYNYAIVDTKSRIKDVGSLFLNGASDYISKTALDQNLAVRRFKKAVDFYPLEMESAPEDVPLSGRNWIKIKPGREYTFCFFYIQMELKEDWIIKAGKDHKQEVKSEFYKHIESDVDRYGGRIWIREEFKQIALFPYDGDSCSSILLPMRLMLDRTIISAEKYSLDDIVEFSMVFHIGNTVYKKSGETGNIISDDLNLIHHLSINFGKKGDLLITQNAAPYIPEGLMHMFNNMGNYKEIQIYRMKQPDIR